MIYNVVIYFVLWGIAIASLFNEKVRKMWRGERDAFRVLRENVDPSEKYIWFHAASLGEFEQGRPLMERIRRDYPQYKILLTFYSPSGYEVRKNYEGADIIISGAGLPTELPDLVKGSQTKIAPIVSTDKSAKVILKYWDRKYKRTADLVVIEGPQAGGHLGFHKEELEKYTEESYSEEIKKIITTVKSYAEKYQTEIPVIVAGGIYDREDVQKVDALGADGVQVATRFITTEECDADIRYKEAHLKAKESDIAIVKSPVGMPGRAIMNKFMTRVMNGEQIPHSPCHGCLVKCSPKEIPYCITDGLINAVKGNIDDGLLFCGAKAWKADHLQTVPEVINDLF